MPAKKKKATKKPKTYRFDLTLKSLFVWSMGLFLVLIWIFILGILVGRGDISFGKVKNKLAEVQGDISEIGRSDTGAASPKNPKFAFYKELASKKKEAAVPQKPTPAKKPVSRKKTVESLKPKTAVKTPPKPAAKQGYQYIVQIASFQDRDKASALVEQLKKQNMVSFFSETQVKGKSYFRVKCGPYKTEKDADKVKKQIAEKNGLHGFVTRMN